MTNPLHPSATEHLPIFIPAPGSPDVLMNIMALFLVVMVLLTGILFFRLHTLPERLAHKSQKIQFEIVAVLGLLALFTHEHIFWVAGLLLAFVDLPDFSTPIRRMATSLEHMAGRRRRLDPGEEPWIETPVSGTVNSGEDHSKRRPDTRERVAPLNEPKA
jgi:multisubunit Na+/H+ antiporter MnhF subunit